MEKNTCFVISNVNAHVCVSQLPQCMWAKEERKEENNARANMCDKPSQLFKMWFKSRFVLLLNWRECICSLFFHKKQHFVWTMVRFRCLWFKNTILIIAMDWIFCSVFSKRETKFFLNMALIMDEWKCCFKNILSTFVPHN